MIKNHYSSTIHHFDSVKWKKRLINFSHKLHRSHNNHHHRNATSTMPTTSATAMAAATEKFIRHSNPSPSDIVIHSEDLTASQFANMTGIKTKRNSIYSTNFTSDKYDDDDDDEIDSDEDDEDSRDYYYSTTSVSSSNKQACQPVMRIWDSHFWQDNNASTPIVAHRKSLPTTPTMSSSLPSSTSMKEISSLASSKATNTTLTSQPLCRHTSEPGGNKVPSMIQKGRFKIVWGNDDDTQPIVAPTSNCVEWKRKRAGSSSSAI